MKSAHYFFIAALLLLLLASVDIVWWFWIWSDTRSYEENQQQWISLFPQFLQNGKRITAINILCIGASIVGFWKARQLHKLRIISIVLLVIASVLFLWQVFTLS
ncbi:MAG: hypothetical protein V4450_07890 [Bacteroidota bacterium]